jgi:hypothetical protein
LFREEDQALKRLLAVPVAAIISALFSTAAVAAEKPAYVKSLVAKVYSVPDFGGKVVGTVPRGEAVSVVESRPQWNLVKRADLSGWVSSMILSDTPPLQSGSVFESQEHDLSKGARRRASSVATSGASRGLVSEERQRLEEMGTKADYVSLRKVEERVTDPQKALSFLNGLEK